LLVNDSAELLRPVLVGLLLVPIVALTSIRQAAMQGLGRVVLGRLPETIFAPALFLALVGVSWGFAEASVTATWAVALQVGASFAAFLLGAALLWRVLPHHAKTEPPEHAMREWVRSALPLLLFSAIQALNAQVEVILLGAIKGSTQAGLYSVAVRVSGIAAFAVLAAGYPLSPMIARLHAAGEADVLRRTVRRAAIAIFVASLPLALGVIVLAGPLLHLFGADFKGGETALILIVIGQLGYAAMGLAGMVLVMTGHETWLTKGVLVGAVANVALNALLIPPYGLNGAAAGSTIATLLMNACLVYFARRRAHVPSSAFGI
jgi:O-antigen/teichoic acid export membrane protein